MSKMEEMCNEAVRRELYTLKHVPDHLKTKKMCEEVIQVRSEEFFLIPDRFKTQEMCIRAAKEVYGSCTVLLIGLWCYEKCSVKTLIIMIILLGGAMYIKKSLNKRRVNAYCLASIKMMGLVYFRR